MKKTIAPVNQPMAAMTGIPKEYNIIGARLLSVLQFNMTPVSQYLYFTTTCTQVLVLLRSVIRWLFVLCFILYGTPTVSAQWLSSENDIGMEQHSKRIHSDTANGVEYDEADVVVEGARKIKIFKGKLEINYASLNDVTTVVVDHVYGDDRRPELEWLSEEYASSLVSGVLVGGPNAWLDKLLSIENVVVVYDSALEGPSKLKKIFFLGRGSDVLQIGERPVNNEGGYLNNDAVAQPDEKQKALSSTDLARIGVDSKSYLKRLNDQLLWSSQGAQSHMRFLQRSSFVFLGSMIGVERSSYPLLDEFTDDSSVSAVLADLQEAQWDNDSAGLPEYFVKRPMGDPLFHVEMATALSQNMARRTLSALANNLAEVRFDSSPPPLEGDTQSNGQQTKRSEP